MVITNMMMINVSSDRVQNTTFIVQLVNKFWDNLESIQDTQGRFVNYTVSESGTVGSSVYSIAELLLPYSW